jgi:hypothetical protein
LQDAVPIGLMSGDLTELMQYGKLRVKDKVTGAEAELRTCLLPYRWRNHDSVDLVAAKADVLGMVVRGNGWEIRTSLQLAHQP